ncbi:nitroreductase [Thomasclavelia sp.]|uniref:nitroreductase family protein n=1 Tax=Thomasclavelia sp. TaxID=3025757 RepID=UPI0025DED830|nr:nitroreductase [Thomasclavelia sp.]
MNEVVNSLINRRSVRSYQDKQVDQETLDQILEAGLYAPSGMDRQPTIMVVVQDKETIAYLSKLNAAVMNSNNDPFYGAPTVVIVLADATVGTYIEDGSLVMGNLMNAANALGVDSCWINRAKEVFNSKEGKELLNKWGIDEKYVGIGNCILGYANGEKPTAKPRKDKRIYRI